MPYKGMEKPVGMYSRSGQLVLTPQNQAKELVFPEPSGGTRYFGAFPGRIEQAEDPFLQEALERDGHEAFADAAPRGPSYPIWALEIAAETRETEESWEDIQHSDENEAASSELLLPLYSFDSSDDIEPFGSSKTSKTCDCHSGVCTFEGNIRARGAKPLSHHAKFPRSAVPLSCGQCLNSFAD